MASFNAGDYAASVRDAEQAENITRVLYPQVSFYFYIYPKLIGEGGWRWLGGRWGFLGLGWVRLVVGKRALSWGERRGRHEKREKEKVELTYWV